MRILVLVAALWSGVLFAPVLFARSGETAAPSTVRAEGTASQETVKTGRTSESPGWPAVRRTSDVLSPGWPAVHGPFSWADRVMNSGTIARSGGVTLLRAKTAELFTPRIDIVSYPVPAGDPTSVAEGPVSLPGQLISLSVPNSHSGRPISISGRLGFFSYALGSGLYEDAAALLFSDGLFAPSDTLQYLRGLVAYDVHDFERAREAFGTVPEGSAYYSQARSFIDIYTSTPKLPDYRDKSPLLAGALSAVIPGSGKIYAGDLRSGISTLLIVGALGGIAAESWVKLGPKDWRTITLSSVFGLFYIGNIYGSALSVSVIKNSYQNAQKATLLFDLRIPLHQF